MTAKTDVPGRPDIEGDTRRLWDVLSNGGTAVFPTDLGYGFGTGSKEGVDRINATKQRGSHKRQGMLTGNAIQSEIHILEQHQWDIINCIAYDYKLPIGIIAKYRPEHPLMRKMKELHPDLLKLTTAQGTLASDLNAGGPFVEALCQLSLENLQPIIGSSANVSGRGSKYRVEDIEPEILDAADLVLDYGLCRYYTYQVSATHINFVTMEVTRMGACYDLIGDILKRRFNWEVPPDPGREVSPNGHVNEFSLLGVEE
jgi:tRNA A37 threonylcarbamoyladenosine synthetase subunit TsaC/SUA5/YrdC